MSLPACRYHLHGLCHYDAESCRNSHATAALAAVPLCSWHDGLRSNSCPYDGRCRFAHGTLCHCDGYVLHPFGGTADTNHKRECGAWIEANGGRSLRQRRNAARARASGAAPQASSSSRRQPPPVPQEAPKCGICLEELIEGPDAEFGVHVSCPHVFCFKCITNWRQTTHAEVQGVVKACPTCRCDSKFILKARRIPRSTQERDQMVATFRASKRDVPCRKFAESGFCPFGSDCFYAHRDAHGRHVELPTCDQLYAARQRRNSLRDAISQDHYYGDDSDDDYTRAMDLIQHVPDMPDNLAFAMALEYRRYMEDQDSDYESDDFDFYHPSGHISLDRF